MLCVNPETLDRWRADFELLFEDSSGHVSARLIQQRAARSDVANSWRDELPRLAERHVSLVVDGHWVSGPDDLLTIIGQARRETFHCRVIAWLLDPVGRHGLGVSFLSSVLKHTFPDEEFDHTQLAAIRRRVEETAAESRADIVLSADHLTIVIEVKLDAKEGGEQCDRLHKDFSNRPNPHFIFLTLDGRSPVSASRDAARAFKSLSLRQLAKLLDQARVDRPAPSSHAEIALLDYRRTLELVLEK